MIGTDKDALLCDLAETYGVFSFDSVPIMTLATLCAGLHDDSRIRLKLAGYREVRPQFTLVHIADALTVLLSALSESKDKPAFYSQVMTGKRTENKKKQGFDSIAEFDAARKRILNG